MLKKEQRRIKRHQGLRKKLMGTAERPRLSIHRSAKNLFVQIIDDTQEKTLLACSTLDKAFRETIANKKKTKQEAASELGAYFVQKIKDKGIQKIAFDRGGYKYHGRIKALAGSLREAGIDF